MSARPKNRMKQTHEIFILNQKFTLKSESERSHVNQVAELVNQMAQKVVVQNKTTSTLQALLLTSLNLADELLKQRRIRLNIVNELENKIKVLIQKIEQQEETELQNDRTVQSPDESGYPD